MENVQKAIFLLARCLKKAAWLPSRRPKPRRPTPLWHPPPLHPLLGTLKNPGKDDKKWRTWWASLWTNRSRIVKESRRWFTWPIIYERKGSWYIESLDVDAIVGSGFPWWQVKKIIGRLKAATKCALRLLLGPTFGPKTYSLPVWFCFFSGGTKKAQQRSFG